MESENRRISLFDMMIFIACIAACLSVYPRSRFPEFGVRRIGRIDLSRDGFLKTMEHVSYITSAIVPFLFGATAALFVIRMRHPRPPLCLTLRQPGAAACAVASLSAAVCFVHWWITFRIPVASLTTLFFGFTFAWIRVSPIGCAVAAVWLHMKLTRCWDPEPHFIDRAGRAVGWIWIASILVGRSA